MRSRPRRSDNGDLVHEQALIREVVARALERCREAGAARVLAVDVSATAGGHLTEETALGHFDSAARGTPAEGAHLRIRWVPAAYRCIDCLARFASVALAEEVLCPHCGGPALPLGRAGALKLHRVEVEGP